MKIIQPTLPHLIAIFGLVFATSAMAQYVWLDASGRKVFSDQPPPVNIPAKRVLQQPGKAATSAVTGNADTKTDANEDADGHKITAKPKTASAPAQAAPSKDKDLEAAKKKIDDEAATKKQIEQEKTDAAKADNCKRAKSAKATLDSGIRLAQTNAKGERGYMDDASRAVETKRIEGIMATDCKVN